MKTFRNSALLVLLGSLCGLDCNKTTSLCSQDPTSLHWCYSPLDVESMSALDRSSDTSLTLALKNPESVASGEPHYYLAWQQGPISGGGDIPDPDEASVWNLSLTAPMPTPSQLTCGPMNLYVSAGKFTNSGAKSKVLSNLPTAEPEKSNAENFGQHGMTLVQVIDGSLASYQALFHAMPISPTRAWANDVQTLGTCTTLGQSYVWFNVENASSLNPEVWSAPIHLDSVPFPSLGDTSVQTFQKRVGLVQRQGQPLILQLDLMGPTPVLKPCQVGCPDAGTCSMGAPLPDSWTSSKVKSLAVEPNAQYIALVDANAPFNLLIYSFTLGTGGLPPPLTDISLQGPVYPGYRFVAIGNLDGSGAEDVLALSITQDHVPLVLLDGRTPQSKFAKTLAMVAPELTHKDAVVTFGKLNQCESSGPTDLFVATTINQPQQKIFAVYAADGEPLAKSQFLKKRDITPHGMPGDAHITAMFFSKPYLFVALITQNQEQLYVYKQSP